MIVDVGFGDSSSVYGDCDKCRLLYYVFDVRTYVGLSFNSKRLVDCGMYVEVLFQKGILSVRFFNLH